MVVKDAVAARKVQKADREKLRRDRLNEQFVELGNVLGNISLLSIYLLLCARSVCAYLFSPYVSFWY